MPNCVKIYKFSFANKYLHAKQTKKKFDKNCSTKIKKSINEAMYKNSQLVKFDELANCVPYFGVGKIIRIDCAAYVFVVNLRFGFQQLLTRVLQFSSLLPNN